MGQIWEQIIGEEEAEWRGEFVGKEEGGTKKQDTSISSTAGAWNMIFCRATDLGFFHCWQK